MSDQAIIQTAGLTVYYGQQRGIVDLDLAVQPGEIFGFLGPNGAGKTTTLRVLLDIIRPTRGSATIFGLDTRQDGVAIRQRVGYVPGELALPTGMRARNYLGMVDALRPQPSDPDYRRKLCARLDLDISRRIGDYSRGNKQKVALVAAFMHRPDLLILDEPTTGLDPLVQQTVLALVREAREEGRTVFFSSHILPEVQAVCDRIGIIRDGRLVRVERIADLLARRVHRLRISFTQRPADDAFAGIDGVRRLERGPAGDVYEVQDLDEFLRRAVLYGISDLRTLDLSLEEVFLAYYGRNNNGQANSGAPNAGPGNHHADVSEADPDRTEQAA